MQVGVMRLGYKNVNDFVRNFFKGRIPWENLGRNSLAFQVQFSYFQ